MEILQNLVRKSDEIIISHLEKLISMLKSISVYLSIYLFIYTCRKVAHLNSSR